MNTSYRSSKMHGGDLLVRFVRLHQTELAEGVPTLSSLTHLLIKLTL
ncbi:hypothetical protein [Secundilactobacillus silagincola]|nr:hypothetical protein [Secundilactobacillus silagincola]